MNRIKLGTLAHVTTPADLATDHLLAIARERAPDPSVFDHVFPFFWQVRASSNRLDFYDTRMRPATTLQNFARALADGVSYQDSHHIRKNGWGQSLTGYTLETDESDPDTGDRITEVWAELFTLPGLELSGQTTDSFIDAVRAGIWRDVSVGFHASDIECSICGQQSFEWWKEDGCRHIPGHTYTVEDKNLRAFAWINDGELVELSQVYKGASPAAAVIKAEQMNEAGQLPEGERAFIERRHGIRIAEPARIWTPGTAARPEARNTDKQRREHEVSKERTEHLTDGTRQAIEEALTRVADLDVTIPGEDQPLGARVTALADIAEQIVAERAALTFDLAEERAARAKDQTEIERLRPLADDGVAYRTQLIDDAIAAGARAHGAEFREEVYRGILDRLDLSGIRTMLEDFSRQGDALLAGGRITRDTEEVPAERSVDPDRHRG
jgi:hypothetical protein